MKRILLSTIVGSLLLVAATPGRAEEVKPAAEKPDRYALPQGGVPELFEFVAGLTQIQPQTPKEDIEHRSKFRPALQQAAEKIVQLEKDKNSDAWRTAAFILLANRVCWIARGTPAQQRQTVSDVKDYLEQNLATEHASQAASLALTAAQTLQGTGQYGLAAEAYRSFAAPLSKSTDRDVAALGSKMETEAQRLQAMAKAYPSPAPPVELTPKGPLVPLDFQYAANRNEADISGPGAWEGNGLAELPQREQTLGGVRFTIGQRLIQLHPTASAGRPTKVEGIPVNRGVARLYVLHGAQLASGPDGTVLGQYRIHYADGATESMPIVLGKDLRDWWDSDQGRPVTRGRVVWTGSNRFTQKSNVTLRLYLGVWVNPHPDKAVAAIDYLRAETRSLPFCVAMTLEEPVGQTKQ